MIETLGHFVIDSQIGRGGMGVVFKAHEPSLNRMVAVKLLGEHLAKDSEFVQRFQREAQLAAALNHPNVVQIYSFGEDNGRYYFAMEYVDGISVQEMIKKDGKLSPDQAARFVLQAAEGLAAAHDRGMIHRDIKPANLMINQKGVVKITDFGIALRPTDQNRLTSTGMLMGTPGYLSPEQYCGKDVDARTDIYALGVSLFEMLTGKVPFNANSPAALMQEILEGRSLDLSYLEPTCPGELLQIVEKMMYKDPDQRYQNGNDIAADLDRFLRERNSEDKATALIATSPPRGTDNPNEGKTTPISRPPSSPPPIPRRSPIFLILAIIFVAVVLLSAGGVVLVKSGIFDRSKELIAANASDQDADKMANMASQYEEEQDAMGSDEAAVEDDQEPGTGAATQKEKPQTSTGVPYEKKPAMRQAAEPSPLPATGQGAAIDNAQQQQRIGMDQAPVSIDRGRPAAPAPPPVVMVAALGDPLLGNAMVQEIEKELGDNGVDVREAFSYPDVQRQITYSKQGRGDVSALLAALAPHCSTAVVARIEVVSDRQLRYYGQVDTAWTADFTVAVYDTASGTPQGRSCRQRLEYTTIGVGPLLEVEMKECRQSLLTLVQKHLDSLK